MSFKARLITFIFSATTLVVAVFFVIAYISLDITEGRFSEETIRGKNVLWLKITQDQLKQMEANTTSLTRAQDALKDLGSGNSTELKNAAQPTFNRLSSSEVINRFQIADKSGAIVYSAPQNFSGQSGKELVKKAMNKKKVFRGIERDDDGTIVTEFVFPLYYNRKYVGVGIYMSTMQKAIDNFKSFDGSEVHLLSDSGEAEYSTAPEQFKLIQPDSETKDNSVQFKQQIGDQVMSLVQLPILDSAGSRIANMLTATDYTTSYDKQTSIYRGGILAGLTAFILSMILIYWFIVHAFKPMEKLLAIMHHISSGDLTDDIKVDCPGEFGLLMSGLEGMQEKLRNMIVDINAATSQIEGSAGNLDRVSHESSQRVENQSQITSQLVDNINQLIQASNEVSGSAEDTKNETDKADGEVSNGRSVIGKVVETIKTISEQVNRAEAVVQNVQNDTESIGAVLGVIKGIAEQTNLLALNAAIEAARAGEQGRGFAVVADEVRTLASRTQESTSEIEAMIDALQKGATDAVSKMTESIGMVEKGAEIANQADESFNIIAGTVSSVNQKSIHISSAANNQMSLSQTMHDNVQSINAVAEEAVVGNKSSVQSTEELIQLAHNLKQKVSQFQTST